MKHLRGMMLAAASAAVASAQGTLGTKAEPAAWTLSNDQVKFEFTQVGLSRATDRKTGLTVSFKDLGASIALDGELVDTANMLPAAVEAKPHDITFDYSAPYADLQVVFELKPGRRFLSKRILAYPKTTGQVRVGKVEPFRVEFMGPTYRQAGALGSSPARFLRLNAAAGLKAGMFLLLQNPFLEAAMRDQQIVASYSLDTEWQAADGRLASDWFCIGFTDLAGDSISGTAADLGEWSAVRACRREFLDYPPAKPLRVHVAWGDNQGLLDAANPADLAEYKRVIDQAADLGCDYVLFEPPKSLDGGRAPDKRHTAQGVPAPVQALLDYAQSKKVGLPVTVYPLMQAGNADIGLRSFQDALVDATVDLIKRTGVGGVYLDYSRARTAAATSEYARWSGAKRVLALLRERLPGAYVDEAPRQPSFDLHTAHDIPDLHVDRVVAFRQRAEVYRQAIEGYAPTELLCGCATHRPESSGTEAKDWDVLGAHTSLLSAVATAPFSLTLGAIPARDPDEFKALSDADRAWFREWMTWPEFHKEYARAARPIIGPPMLGSIDGTSMILHDKGYVFLFNPNYRRLNAEFRLDDSIGLSEGRRWTLRQIYPGRGVLFGRTGTGVWSRGDTVNLPMEGTSEIVLQVEPAHDVKPLTVFGIVGDAHLADGVLAMDEVEAEPGSRVEMAVAVPHGENVTRLTVNGKLEDFKRVHDLVTATLQFKDRRFSRAQGLSVYSPTFAGRAFHSEFSVPKSVFMQLSARKKAWPVPYTADELQRPWLGSNRLLMFIDIAEPDDAMKVQVKIDGDPVELRKAYCRTADGAGRVFLGFYADVSDLDPEDRHGILVTLPELKPGRFQGVFFENVESDTTDEVYAKGERPPKAAGESD